MGSCSHMLQGGGFGLLLLLEEEACVLDAVMGIDGLCLSVLSLLDDGLEPSTEGSSLGVI
jgi:hypothetical protein